MAGVEIIARGLTRIYPAGGKALTAIDDIDLTISAGTLTALMGPSGSGKSTLLHLIGGMDTPTAGTLTVGEWPLHQLTRHQLTTYRRHVGFVFQRFHLLPALTALDNVAAPLLPYQRGRKLLDRACALLSAVGLDDRTDALPAELSGGEQQRVAIARALINDPPLLIADEPTGNLDSATGASILDLLDDLHERAGTTIVVATHDQAVAQRCARAIAIRDGRIIS
jgi:putative ABC transport system ATP-binding protein